MVSYVAKYLLNSILKSLPVREWLVSFIKITNLIVLLFPSVAFPLTCNWIRYSFSVYIIHSKSYITYLLTTIIIYGFLIVNLYNNFLVKWCQLATNFSINHAYIKYGTVQQQLCYT